MAVNAYWSPLFSWLMAPTFLVVGADRRNDLVFLHTLNLLIYLFALFLFDRLVSRLAALFSWNSPSARTAYTACAYFAFYWAALEAVNVSLSSPDVLVFALVLLLSLLLLRIRTTPVRLRTFVLLGTALGLAYLAKTAMLTIAPLYMAAAVWPLKWNRDTAKKLVCVFAPLVVVAVPWILALRVATGYWTVGDSGKLNFAWEMCGAERWTHWQGEPGTIGQPLHPTRKLMTAPAVYEFAGPVASVSTYAPWYDPAYWYRGIKPSITAWSHEGVMNLLRNWRYLGWLILITPGILPGLLFFPRVLKGAGSDQSRFGVLRALAIPAAALLTMYTFVFVDKRYVGGSILILALVLLAVVIPGLRSQRAINCFRIVSFTACLCSLLLPLIGELGMLSLDRIPPQRESGDGPLAIADDLRALGLRPGDHIAFVGLGIRAYWPAIYGLHIVSEIPVRPVRTGRRWDNQDTDDSSNVELFWHSSQPTRDEILALLKRSGARAVVSDWVPSDAQTEGWIELRASLLWRTGENGKDTDEVYRHRIYVRFL